jgi:hypothetical protein
MRQEMFYWGKELWELFELVTFIGLFCLKDGWWINKKDVLHRNLLSTLCNGG